MIDRLQQRLAEIGAPDDVLALASALADQAVRDPLSGLFNRRFFDEALAQQEQAARRYGRPLSLALFDLDRLKQVNDSFGHEAGDAVLRAFADVLRGTARRADVPCRIGGDEFALILPETTPAAAQHCVDRVLRGLSGVDCAVPGIGRLPVRASAGLAGLPCDALFSTADVALLRAKRRNNS